MENEVKIIKAYKIRCFPTEDQKELILKTFGCCRFVYNQTLAYRKEKYEKLFEKNKDESCLDKIRDTDVFTKYTFLITENNNM